MTRPRLVVLDRDGVINEDSGEFIKSVAEWRPISGSLEAIAALTRAGFRVAVVTNQSGVGRGLFDRADARSDSRSDERRGARRGRASSRAFTTVRTIRTRAATAESRRPRCCADSSAISASRSRACRSSATGSATSARRTRSAHARSSCARAPGPRRLARSARGASRCSTISRRRLAALIAER